MLAVASLPRQLFLMSNLSHTIRKFDRFELKYLVPMKTAAQFKESLGAYLVPDDHGDSRGCYYLSSLYYDGPDLRFYWEKVDGINVRRKLRIRHYDACEPLTDNSLVVVEIKQRVNRVTQKRRAVMPYCDALRMCDERLVPEHDPQDAAVIDEITCMLWQYNLRPASIVRYARQALVGTEYDVGLRVTFDNDLSYQVGHLELHEDRTGLPLFPPGWTVVEIKVNERMPYWLTDLVAMHNLSLVRVSKYCQSIALARDLAAPGWRFPLG
ncbi:MAG: polyphosphate polymerase domain-containing protein [Chloroflexi bacterium]|nr:polyphosphate polymerase domain-containing protein [Chloroflexota bacterium]